MTQQELLLLDTLKGCQKRINKLNKKNSLDLTFSEWEMLVEDRNFIEIYGINSGFLRKHNIKL